MTTINMPLATADQIIARLALQPHPEGGYYREVYRSESQVVHPDPGAGQRSACTSIYFLLTEGDFSAFHRVRSDEVWHLYAGGPLELFIIGQHGEFAHEVLALDLGAGFQPQITVPANCLQAARPAPNVPWALCGCVVAPGFDFADFAMPSREDLSISFPHLADLIRELTRPA